MSASHTLTRAEVAKRFELCTSQRPAHFLINEFEASGKLTKTNDGYHGDRYSDAQVVALEAELSSPDYVWQRPLTVKEREALKAQS